ncbi:MAG: threonine-phosphate decarboxylase CobD [Alphaproteobacteria bacterium]|nr:threonine-phosphate decarboxylase CobD [Alphaproteobacteria bacterium]
MSSGCNRQVEHGGGLTAACESFGGEPQEWLDLSTGINPNPVTMPAISNTVWQRLPDTRLVDCARCAAANHYRVTDGVLPLPVAGVQNAIQLLPQITDGPVAVLGPTYDEYRYRFELAGRPVDVIPELSGVKPAHRVVVVVNPNNPDGRTHAPEILLRLAGELASRDGTLVVDEAFADMRPELSLAGYAGRQPGLVVLRSFGKFFGLAGLRLGFVMADGPTLDKLDRLQGPWAVSGPALEVARVLLNQADIVRSVSRQIIGRRQALETVLEQAGLSVLGGADLFLLVDDARAKAIHELLCKQHILTRIFQNRPNWIRFGLCADRESDQRLGHALAQID